MILNYYIRIRSQTVAFNGFTSRCFPTTYGIPQGSHLGPYNLLLLF